MHTFPYLAPKPMKAYVGDHAFIDVETCGQPQCLSNLCSVTLT